MLEFLSYVFRIKAEPITDAGKRVERMPILAEEPFRRLLRPVPLPMRHANYKFFLKTE